MSMSTQLEELQRRKAQLENELRSIEEKEKAMGTGLKIVEEKAAVQELEEKVKAKRAVVERLESKKRELERKLKEPNNKEPIEVVVKVAPGGDQQPEGQKEKKKLVPALIEKLS